MAQAVRLNQTPDTEIQIQFEGETITALATDSVAAALIASGIRSFRNTPVESSPRGPYCLMGVCFDCLVEIDGAPNQQACMITVKPAMTVRRMHGARASASVDALTDNSKT